MSGRGTWPSPFRRVDARDALKRIRELHRVNNAAFIWPKCVECHTDWPCATAKLVYPTEELT